MHDIKIEFPREHQEFPRRLGLLIQELVQELLQQIDVVCPYHVFVSTTDEKEKRMNSCLRR